MSSLTAYFSSEFIEAFGWTLVHSLWQGMVLIALLSLILGLVPSLSSRVRYLMSLGFLLLLTIWFGVTLASEYHSKLAGDDWQMELIFSEGGTLVHERIIHTNELPWFQSLTAFLEPAIAWLPLFWFVGTILFSLRWLGGYFYLQRIRTQDVRILNYEWQSRLNKLAQKMGVSQTLLLKESSRINSPMVIGHMKPVILVPLGLLTGIAPAHIEAILAHEIAHIQRYDFLVNLIQSTLEMVFFYHPAYWWLSARISDERENCCDDIAVEVCGDAVTYARALAEVEAQKQESFALAMQLQGRKNYLTYRIKRIVMPQSSVENNKNKAFFTALLVLGLCSGIWLSPGKSFADDSFVPQPAENLFLGNQPFLQAIVPVDTPPPPPPVKPEKPTVPEVEPTPPGGESPVTPPMPPSLETIPTPELPVMPEMPEMPAFEVESFTPEMKAAFEAEMKAFEESQKKWEEEMRRSMEQYAKAMKAWEKDMEQQYRDMDETQRRDMEKLKFEFQQDWEKRNEERALREEMRRQRDEMRAQGREMREQIQKEHLLRQELTQLEAQRLKEELHQLKELQHLKEIQADRELAEAKARMERSYRQLEREKERMARVQELQESKVQRDLESTQRELKREMERLEREKARIHEEAEAIADRERARFEALRAELTPELKEDGFIRRNNQRVTITTRGGEMKINGKTLTNAQERKYRKLLKKHGVEIGSGSTLSFKFD